MIAKVKLCAFMVNCKEIANNKAVSNSNSLNMLYRKKLNITHCCLILQIHCFCNTIN